MLLIYISFEAMPAKLNEHFHDHWWCWHGSTQEWVKPIILAPWKLSSTLGLMHFFHLVAKICQKKISCPKGFWTKHGSQSCWQLLTGTSYGVDGKGMGRDWLFTDDSVIVRISKSGWLGVDSDLKIWSSKTNDLSQQFDMQTLAATAYPSKISPIWEASLFSQQRQQQ